MFLKDLALSNIIFQVIEEIGQGGYAFVEEAYCFANAFQVR